MNYFGFAVTVFAAFMAISNPIAITPMFLSITNEETDEVRRAIALRAVLVAFAIIAVLCVTGNAIFALLGITVSALQLTGGAVAFIIGFRMLQGEPTSAQSPRLNGAEVHDGATMLDTAISPLAVPILVGPGTIATALSYTGRGDPAKVALTITAFAMLCLITYVLFIFGKPLVRYLGRTGIRALNRLMGLVLAVVGVQLLLKGVAGAIVLLRV
jgi:multiple antibiotic resistance protein